MPSHHGVGLDEHERRPPVPPRVRQRDPKQAISPPELRTAAGAFQGVELLAERFASNTTRDLGLPPSNTGILQAGFAASPDASTIAWCQMDARLSDLVLLESWVPPGPPR